MPMEQLLRRGRTLPRRGWCALELHAQPDSSFGTYGSNKFYMGQLIVDHGQFLVFRKWGRLGAKTPQSSVKTYYDVEAAEEAFSKTFQSKSGNEWPLTKAFESKKGKYSLVELDDGEPEPADDAAAEEEKREKVASKLSQEVQNIVKERSEESRPKRRSSVE
uniref:NAD(+) ADP-ribosyltransferase n=2 Tax=Phytophthora fragariae TaxID=53985 RepID=A0A6A3EBW9_9STRA|nr:hypothetical protein PF009_g18832 [Phytophthora fragariae]